VELQLNVVPVLGRLALHDALADLVEVEGEDRVPRGGLVVLVDDVLLHFEDAIGEGGKSKVRASISLLHLLELDLVLVRKNGLQVVELGNGDAVEGAPHGGLLSGLVGARGRGRDSHAGESQVPHLAAHVPRGARDGIGSYTDALR